ncbi:MAG: hypothetical protein ABW219_09385 [Ilumatobacteraceae bacterium]
MNTRAMVRAGGATLMSLVSVIGVQGVGASAMASPRVVHATGTATITDTEFVDYVSRGQQCIIRVDQVTAYTGDLEGTWESTRPSEIRYFATCDELFATDGAGIPSAFSAVGHFVGTDGSEATLRAVGRTDAAGNYRGIIAAHGEVNGVLQESASFAPGSPPNSTYDGILVIDD